MDETMYSLINGMSDKKNVEVGVLVKLAGVQVVAEAEKLGYIETTDNEIYHITLAGRFKLLVPCDNSELFVNWKVSNDLLAIDLGYDKSLKIKIQPREHGLYLQFITDDDAVRFEYASNDTLAILAKIFTFFNENVL